MLREKHIQLWLAVGGVIVGITMYVVASTTKFEEHCVSSRERFDVHCISNKDDFCDIKTRLKRMDDKLDILLGWTKNK